MTPAEARANPWAFGPWCWVVAEVRCLPERVLCRGMPGTFPLERIPRQFVSTLAGRMVDAAISLQQPYASAVAAGVKPIENRTWRRVVPPEGLWLGLHAGRQDWPNGGALLDQWRSERDPSRPRWTDAPLFAELPRGCLIGVIRVSAIHRYEEGEQARLLGSGW